ncbi:Uncharacterised protein [Salmonella enterica subsp. enterica serovar Bovismorbificans]|uniref:Uncharacterized protein n=1 Tax=Salmonella enterica subsp. enterica serovar Bovismorbificans TaxID=58097 RepID=A0A655E7Z2_SALET|nr:Uncharacterised protein [Salmonella enterica subsp. enterica serovar Bovismorbificans]
MTRLPINLNNRLPSATRRAAALAALLLSIASSPDPRLAPMTRHNATGNDIIPAAVRVAVSNTAARLE